ncbi:hypothetical protein DF19_37545 [Streptomyces olindensis]|nr:hypothetical protein DF19_37545 [Streptomyces olindensis]
MNADPQPLPPTDDSPEQKALSPREAALVRLAEHFLACPICRAVDDEGANLNLPCETDDRLLKELRAARHTDRTGLPHDLPAE